MPAPRIALISLLCVLLLEGCISGRLVGFRSLSTTSWGYGVVESPVRAGKQSQRFEVRPGDCAADGKWSDCKNNRERSEYSLRRAISPGRDTWIAFSVYVPEDFADSPRVATSMGQIHQKGGPSGTAGGLPSFPPLLQLNMKGGLYRACIHILSGSPTNIGDRCDYYTLAALDDMRGRWTDVTIHFDTTDRTSLMEIFVNGEEKARLSDFVRFWPKEYYVKYGLYRSFVSRHGGPMPTQVAWFDEVRIGKTREAVAIDPANPVD